MGMGIVSDEEFDTALVNSKVVPREESNSPSGIINPLPTKGRGEGNVEVPNGLRKIIGETSEIEGRSAGVELAKQFGISPSSVSAYAQGATGTADYHNPKQEIVDHINKSKERISKKARAKLFLALKNITEEKLADAKPDILANVARNMSAIVKDMEPDIPKNPNERVGPTFVLYAPHFRKEEYFDTVVLKED